MKIIAIILVVLSLCLSCFVKIAPINAEEIFFTRAAVPATEAVEPTAAEQTAPTAEIPSAEPLPTSDQKPTVSPDFLPPTAETAVPQATEPREPAFPENPPLPPEETEPVPIQRPEPAPTEQTEPVPAEPAPTGPAPVEPAPTEPAPTEQTEPTGPTVCLHQWVPIQNIPAQFETNHYVVCHCGASFPDAAAWTAHRDGFLGTEDLIRHTGYASGSSKTETAPAMVVWQCSQCGATKTLNALDTP